MPTITLFGARAVMTTARLAVSAPYPSLATDRFRAATLSEHTGLSL